MILKGLVGKIQRIPGFGGGAFISFGRKNRENSLL
jgi:hypothetical protein